MMTGVLRLRREYDQVGGEVVQLVEVLVVDDLPLGERSSEDRLRDDTMFVSATHLPVATPRVLVVEVLHELLASESKPPTLSFRVRLVPARHSLEVARSPRAVLLLRVSDEWLSADGAVFLDVKAVGPAILLREAGSLLLELFTTSRADSCR